MNEGKRLPVAYSTETTEAALAEINRLRGLLARLEWGYRSECPACGCYKSHGGHASGCWLAAELRP
jgi:hypothetical protein